MKISRSDRGSVSGSGAARGELNSSGRRVGEVRVKVRVDNGRGRGSGNVVVLELVVMLVVVGEGVVVKSK